MKDIHGKFVISLDFEIIWGVHDQPDIVTNYGKNLLGVQKVIPRLLGVFEKYKIRATFATVGLLFFSNKKELLEFISFRKPVYKNSHLSPYETELEKLGESEETDKYHFASSLIDEIKKYPNQEICTHTFSHYYCLEEGQTLLDFKEDINAAIKIAFDKGVKTNSMVFPRNQYSEKYLQICSQVGIKCVRGTENSWLYTSRNNLDETLLRRAFRFLDSYFNISGHHCYNDEFVISQKPYNIPSSRFLRPYEKKLGFLEKLRFRRIKKSMEFAAKNRLIYHLWWHPHNFGVNQEENFEFLEKILCSYQELNKKYNFTSYGMNDLVQYLEKKYEY